MTLKEKQEALQHRIDKLKMMQNDPSIEHQEIEELKQEIVNKKQEIYNNLSAYDRVYLARRPDRPHIKDYINQLFDDFIEMHGDRYYGDDQAIVGGIAYFENQPVTIIGHQKGRNLDDNMQCRFGMASPEGYRKAIRLMKQAEKFHRPIITFVDTPGAYPAKEAEENNVGEAIGQCLLYLSHIKTPVIVVVVGEGGSGGALALSVGDYIVMLENAVYSVLSPEGFASILWKDTKGERVAEACEVMKMTAHDLLDFHIIDEILPEALGGCHEDPLVSYKAIKVMLEKRLVELKKMSVKELIKKRYEKLTGIGQVMGK